MALASTRAPTSGERVANAIGCGVLAFVATLFGQILVWFWPVPVLFFFCVAILNSPESPWIAWAYLVLPVVASVFGVRHGWRLGMPRVAVRRRAVSSGSR